ncbi:MAG TPA: transcription termination factor Rho [Ktedonobacterales bacterium]|nr:transcription termination factor Rho [Ktedonobacterales bacterium]
MPEDQDQITNRRRSRRSSTATPADLDNSTPSVSSDNAASTPLAAAGDAPRATTTRRRAARAPLTDSAITPITEQAPTITDQATEPAERPAARRRVARPRADEAESTGASSSVADDAALAARPKQPRVSRRRGASAAETPMSAGEVAAQASFAPLAESTAPVSAQPANAPTSAEAETSAPARPAYRFARRAPSPATDERLPGGPRRRAPVETQGQSPVERLATEPSAPITTSEPAPAESPHTPHEPAVRPLRRVDRAAWPGQEQRPRRDLGIPGGAGASGGETYRTRGPDQNGARGQGSRQPGQGRGGASQQSGRTNNGPYMPGGRAQSPAGPRESSGFGVIPGGPAGGQGGYGPYTPFDPYTGYPNTPPNEQQQRRPTRNRPGYGNQPNYPQQQGYTDQRGPRTPMESYREREAGLRNPQQGRGQQGGRGQHPPTDRRGMPTTRQARPPRDLGLGRYGNANNAYAPIPDAPNVPAEDRYQSPRSSGPRLVGQTVEMSGVLWLGGGLGMSMAELLDGRTLQSLGRLDPADVRRFGLRTGDAIVAQVEERGNRRSIVSVERVNDREPDNLEGRPVFEQLTASFPDRRIRLEQGPQPISSRIIDLFAPLGFGSRALIVAPPKTGKTTLIREAAESVLKGYPDAVVMAVLVGERPEEVTDLRARLEPRGGLVYAASFDEHTERHAWLVQVAVERAKRVAESGRDAFMVLDSLTRLARAENLATRGQGRTLSGGIDAQALDTGRRAFGAARNLEEGGSLTILATCLVDTGSRQDDVVYEEFKGTGNMELHLSRELAQRRLFPAVDAVKSGTRREEMLLSPEELRAATALRRKLADMQPQQATQQLLTVMERTPSNAALLQAIDQSNLAGRP